MNYFEVLNAVNVGDKIEKKSGLSYLSWAWAWAELKKRHPHSYYTIYENKDGLFYHTDGKTAWVKTGVTLVDGETSLEHIEYLPVMDYRNKSIAIEDITSFDVNKAIQRSLTKAVARHGLGLYIYAGEDLPEEEKTEEKPRQEEKPKQARPKNQTVKKSRSDQITGLCKQYNVTVAKFGEVLSKLQKEGQIVDKHTSKMTDDEFAGMIDMMALSLKAS